MTRAAVLAMGCTLFAPDAPSAAATAVLPPTGVSSTLFVKELKSRFAAIITDGQGEMKGQIFRIAHLGFFDYMDTIALIGALEQVIVKSVPQAGIKFGDGLIAAQNVYGRALAHRRRRKPLPLRSRPSLLLPRKLRRKMTWCPISIAAPPPLRWGCFHPNHGLATASFAGVYFDAFTDILIVVPAGRRWVSRTIRNFEP